MERSALYLSSFQRNEETQNSSGSLFLSLCLCVYGFCDTRASWIQMGKVLSYFLRVGLLLSRSEETLMLVSSFSIFSAHCFSCSSICASL